MPKAFDDCVKNGGKIFTIKIGSNRYRHICKLNGKISYGHIKTKKK